MPDIVITVLSLIHNATTLFFGVYVSAAFLGVKMDRKNIFNLFFFSLGIGVFYVGTFLLFGESVTEKVYPLIIHLPLILFLTFHYRYNFVISALSVITAYLCCQISNWLGVAALDMTKEIWVYYSVRIVVTVTVFIILVRFVSGITAQLMQKPTGSVIILGLMPFIYYLFDYITGVYTHLLYSGLEIVGEFLGFVLCLAYLMFLFLYFRQYEAKCEADRRNQMMEIQQAQTAKEIEAIRRSEYAVSLLRHDMRHFLSGILSYIENGETEKAKEYISQVISTSDHTAMKKYCANEIVNMILSSHEHEMKDGNIDFRCSVQIPSQLPFSDVDITSILSNGLENAIHAVMKLDPEKRRIDFDMHMKEEKLLISIKNTFAKVPEMVDGMPHTSESGHGFGTQSIRYVTEKLGGKFMFSVDGDLFILRVIL